MDLVKAPFTCVIVDDDEVDRVTTLSFAAQYPFLQIVGVYASGEEALPVLEKEPVTVLLLDIALPGLSGLAFRRLMMDVPACLFITSHSQHAFESYELDAFDFLAKPLTESRFAHSMQRLETYLDLRHKASLFEISLGTDVVHIKNGQGEIRIKLHEILYLEALRHYTRIVSAHTNYCVTTNLSDLLREKAFETFVRIHRSYAVQKHFIQRISSKMVFVNDIELPIGRHYKDVLKSFR